MSRELKIGVVITGAMILLIYGFNFFKGYNLLNPRNEFIGVYSNVEGLKSANSVLLSGVKVGQVSEIALLPHNPDSVRVRFSVDASIPVYHTSVAKIISSDLLGSKAIQLVIGKGTKDDLLLPGSVIKSEVQTSIEDAVMIELQPLRKKVESLLVGLEEVTVTVQSALNEDVRANLTASFKRIPKAIDNLTRTTESIDTLVTDQSKKLTNIFANIESISYNLKRSNQDIRATISNVKSISDSLTQTNLAQAINNTEMVLAETNEMMRKLNEGEGSMGKLLNDSILYENLSNSAASIDSLLVDIKCNPHKYLHVSLIDFH